MQSGFDEDMTTRRDSGASQGQGTLGGGRLVLALLAAGVLGGGIGAAVIHGLSTAPQTNVHPLPAQAASAPASEPVADTASQAASARAAKRALPDFEAIARANGPAVVHIPAVGGPGEDDEPAAGNGSGVIVGADGLILTSAQVVRGAPAVAVRLADRREFKARVLGADARTGVAVLRIDAQGLPTVKPGSSQALNVGAWVLAIGSPFGFENSVSAGVVSAKGRTLPGERAVPFLQTDAAINPGSLGGPLFNARGELVGINARNQGRSGNHLGVAFAIPIELAIHVKEQIVRHGRVEHATLGVVAQDVDQTLADSFRLPRPAGALVAGVEPGSPAHRAGLKAGDVITRYDGQPIVTSGDLPARVAMSAPGTSAQLEVIRKGKPQAMTVTLGSAGVGTEAAEPASTAASGPDAVRPGRLGLTLRELTPQERQASQAKGRATGLLVQQASGLAAAAGVKAGDVLLSINGEPVPQVQQVRDIVEAAPKSMALLVVRGGQQVFVPVRLE